MSLEQAWSRLAAVSRLTFQASSHSQSGWQGRGQGTVQVEAADGVMLFHEAGKWSSEAGKTLKFTNTYRWTRDDREGTLRLEHLRFGAQQPVYLFDLGHENERLWRSREPHVCGADLYRATMELGETEVLLSWQVQGPEKDELIEYVYW